MTDTDPRMPLSDLLSAMTPIDGGARVHITPDWLQGRAVYGGLSVALSLQATQNVIGDGLPPLRSVQTSFIGPATSEVDIYPQVVRQGKSTAFVTVDMYSRPLPSVPVRPALPVVDGDVQPFYAVPHGKEKDHEKDKEKGGKRLGWLRRGSKDAPTDKRSLL